MEPLSVSFLFYQAGSQGRVPSASVFGAAPGRDQFGFLITASKKDPSNCGRTKEELRVKQEGDCKEFPPPVL